MLFTNLRYHIVAYSKAGSLLLLAGLFIVCHAEAQNRQHTENNVFDTATINRYINEGAQTFRSKPDSAAWYLGKAEQYSRSINYDEGVVRSLLVMGNAYYGDAHKAIGKLQSSLQEYTGRGLQNNELKDKIYLKLAEAFEAKGVNDSSAYYYYRLGEEVERTTIKDSSFAMSLYFALTVFWLNSNSDINEKDGLAKQYANKARLVAPQSSNNPAIRLRLLKLPGFYYCALGQYDSARYYFQRFLTEGEQAHLLQDHEKVAFLLNISESYLRENNPTAAIPYIRRSMETAGKLSGEMKYMTVSQLQMIKALFLLKQYQQSIRLFKAIELTISRNSFLDNDVVETYKNAAASYYNLGNLPAAVVYQQSYIRLHDSLMNKSKLEMINRLQMRFETAQKDKRLAEQELTITAAKNKVHQKNIWIAGALFTCFSLVIIFSLWFRNSKHKQVLQQERINNFQQQMEITRLSGTIQGEERERNRIAQELHDGIGGLLSAAKMNLEVVKKDYHFNNEETFTTAIRLIDNAAGELRKTAHNMMPEMLQGGFTEAVIFFCNDIMVNHTTRFHVQVIGIPVKLQASYELSLYRIIQELVHNIIKHANAPTAIIEINFFEEGIMITIEDDGVGMPLITRAPSGIGLKSVAERIRVINGTIDIQSTPGKGTGIYMDIPITKEHLAFI